MKSPLPMGEVWASPTERGNAGSAELPPTAFGRLSRWGEDLYPRAFTGAAPST